MKKHVLIILILMFTIVGCSHVNRIDLDGRIIYHITTWDLAAPNTVSLLEVDKNNELVMVNGGLGSGLLGVVAGPAAQAYGMNKIGDGLSKSGDNTNITNQSESNPVTSLESNPITSSMANPITSSMANPVAISNSEQHQSQQQKATSNAKSWNDVKFDKYKHLNKKKKK